MKVPDPLRFVPDEGGGEGITQHDARGSVAVKVAHKPKPVDHHARPKPETWRIKRGVEMIISNVVHLLRYDQSWSRRYPLCASGSPNSALLSIQFTMKPSTAIGTSSLMSGVLS